MVSIGHRKMFKGRVLECKDASVDQECGRKTGRLPVSGSDVAPPLATCNSLSYMCLDLQRPLLSVLDGFL